MMFKNRFRKTKAHDMLEQKRNNLNTYVAQFNSAVTAVTTIVDVLTETNDNIRQTLTEIDDYQKALSCTAEDLKVAKDKNDKVIKNFNALISVD